MTTAAPQQPALARPLCKAPCVLLSQHQGLCTASNGKQWKRQP